MILYGPWKPNVKNGTPTDPEGVTLKHFKSGRSKLKRNREGEWFSKAKREKGRPQNLGGSSLEKKTTYYD